MTPTTTICRHWWRIEAANGPVSLGKCELCGEERLFKNALPDEWPSRFPGRPAPSGLATYHRPEKIQR